MFASSIRVNPNIRNISRCILLLLTCLVCGSWLRAQILPVKKYTVKDGLLSNDIEAIAQDSRGYLWFGTSDGLCVFDGISVTSYTTRDGLPGNFIRQIIRDRRSPGTMWILAGTRVCRYREGEFHTFELEQGGATTIYQDRSGRIWCGTWTGTVIIDGDDITTFDLPALRDGYKEMAEAGESDVWFALERSLVHYSRRDGSSRVVKLPGAWYDVFRSMLGDDEGNLWVVTGPGNILRIRDTSIVGERVSPLGERPPFFASTIYDAGGEMLWLHGYNGITGIPKTGFDRVPAINYTTGNGLSENTIRSAFIDREKNLWLGGRDQGAVKLSTWSILRFPLGSVWYIHHTQFAVSDSNNHIWVIADEKLTEFWKDAYGSWHRHVHDIPRPQSSIIPDFGGPRVFSSLHYSSDGKLWISSLKCPGPIDCFDILPDTSTAGDRPSRLGLVRRMWVGRELRGKSMRVLNFIASRDGDLWVFITGAGLARYRLGLDEPFVDLYSAAEGIPLNYVRCLYESRSGDIWAGSYSGGLVRISGGSRIRTYSTADGLPDNAIWGLNEDHSGRLLIGTSNTGLAFWAGDSSGAFTAQEGLPSSKVFAATEDSFHRLWVASSRGMLEEERAGSGMFLAKQEFLGAAALACGTTRDGHVWFVTPDELIVYDYAHDLPTTTAPLIHINDLKVNGNPSPAIVDVRSPSDENNIEIGFVGISFRDEAAIRYFYRLAGAEERWNGPSPNRLVTYGHLEPGVYRFEVKAMSIGGIESEAPASLMITIERPFWQGGWFIGGMVSVAASMVWIGFRIRTGRIMKEQRASTEFSRRLIDSQEAERKRVAGELHDGVGQSFLVILSRAKMALRDLGRGTATSDLEEIVSTAGQGIEDVRRVAFGLSPYDIGQFGLAPSIETMLKRLTLAAGIRYRADLGALRREIAEGSRIHIYRIIQECVTNAIKHAGASHVSVESLDAGGSLFITVRDDGSGFDQARVSAGDSSSRGFGIAGLRERVKLLNGSLQLVSAKGAGTTVTVTIPWDVLLTDHFRNGAEE